MIKVGFIICHATMIIFHIFSNARKDDFYEGQARLDGAFCNYGAKEKKDFMWRAHVDKKVQNIEMEASTFLGFWKSFKYFQYYTQN